MMGTQMGHTQAHTLWAPFRTRQRLQPLGKNARQRSPQPPRGPHSHPTVPMATPRPPQPPHSPHGHPEAPTATLQLSSSTRGVQAPGPGESCGRDCRKRKLLLALRLGEGLWGRGVEAPSGWGPAWGPRALKRGFDHGRHAGQKWGEIRGVQVESFPGRG